MAEITVYGAPWCPDCRRAKQFLAEHRVEYDWVDIDQDAAARAHVEQLQGGGRTIPTVVLGDGRMLLEPDNDELARALELQVRPSRSFYDLAIVGGGPAGLAAAIYAAREGIDTVVVERSALGGQAGVTNRIDNYPGFPDGISGDELARRFIEQAERFGVELLSAVATISISKHTSTGDVQLGLSSGDEIGAHAVILAPGSTYRRLDVPGETELIGASVHFCSTCDGPFYRGARELAVIGGGNSALEEGLYLTQFADRVRIIHRGDALSGSQVLRDKVRDHERVDLMLGTSVEAMRGNGSISALTLRDRASGALSEYAPDGVFVFIGLQPNTDFLPPEIAVDERGFVVTNAQFETSIAGVFAAGDSRAGSTKQLGAAVGEGITALMMARQYLQGHQHIRAASRGG